MTIKYVYVAGPITQGKPIENVIQGVDVANELMDLGFTPFVPHLSYYHHNLHHARDYEDWLAYDFKWIMRCDALLRLPGHSPGADREIAFCYENDIPVFYSVEQLVGYAEDPFAGGLLQAMQRPITP